MEKSKSANFDEYINDSIQVFTYLDKEKFLINQIMNYLHYDFHNIDLFSTNELERIIVYSGCNRQRTMYLLENYSKEEILKMIEDHYLSLFNKSKSADLSSTLNSYHIKQQRKEVFIIGLKKKIIPAQDIQENNMSAWNFINSHVNIIDLKDLLNSYDHHKLIKQAKSVVKDKDHKKLNEYFEKYTERREKKFQEMFKANLEQNDLNFLGTGEMYMELEIAKKQKKVCMNNITEKLMTSFIDFYTYFNNSSDFVKVHILEYLDIFSLGKLGLVNKHLYELVYKKYNIEKTAKQYCLAIFKNMNLYVNEQDKIKNLYKSYMKMLKYRPRIRFGGVYYSRVRYNKTGDNYGFSDQVITTVIFYRIYRFLPSGDVYCITTPFTKPNKIINSLNKNTIDLKSGRFFIDFDDSLIIELNSGQGRSCIYRYKVSTIEINLLDG